MTRWTPTPRPVRAQQRDFAPPPPRIGAGKHRGRPLLVPPGPQVRPTSSRARESMFDILMHADMGGDGTSPLPGARVLDAFAGAGALGLEALSRGAAHASFMDKAPDAVRTVGDNARTLKETENVKVMRADATQPPTAPPSAACDLAFLDPPYHSELGPKALAALARAGWLAPGAICSLEVAHNEDAAAPEGFTPIDERRYGKAKLLFFRYGEAP
jgi:16S rRNA (guanine966-N2)-methyltransferase